MAGAPRIEDYGLIGDTETAALVSRDGCIDWLCLPRFDSPACFAALLGDAENGRWSLRPADRSAQTTRHYVDETAVLRTRHRTSSGAVTVTDFMPPRAATGVDHIDVVRIVDGIDGTVEMEMELILRFDYGYQIPWVTSDGRWRAIAGPDAVTVDTPVEMRGEDHKTVAEFTVSEGDRVPFVFTWNPSHHEPDEPIDAGRSLDQTLEWWMEWSSHAQFEGPYREAVVRSLVTLKALTYAPTGGIVAAPTTSLPEEIGGVRNWDYRYVWLRDAAFTLYALLMTGYRDEAVQWRDWLLRAVAGSPETMGVMYGVAGERRMPEFELDWLSGYEGSQPVRIGNAAHRQSQIDVYGEVVDALWLARRHGIEPEEGAWNVQRVMLDFLESNWEQADHGLWEMRCEPRHFTHSRLMSWVAFDRAVRTVEDGSLDGPVDRWRGIREEIRDDILTNGYDPDRNSFVQSFGSKEVDAALLLIPQSDFLPGDDPRVVGTIDAVIEDLSLDGSFIRRYRTETTDDGLPGHEGAFLICSFWLVDALALAGRTEEAKRRFEAILDVRNDLGLLAEEYDPAVGRMLGNFPQAFSHIGLIDSACALADAEK